MYCWASTCILEKTFSGYGMIVYTDRVVINPRRACALLVTVLGLSVCLSIHPSTNILSLQATRQLMKDFNIFSATSARKIKWRFS